MNKYNKENPRFWSLDLEAKNKGDLQTWIDNNVLVGLVDEEEGGIIGYISEAHINKLLEGLNAK